MQAKTKHRSELLNKVCAIQIVDGERQVHNRVGACLPEVEHWDICRKYSTQGPCSGVGNPGGTSSHSSTFLLTFPNVYFLTTFRYCIFKIIIFHCFWRGQHKQPRKWKLNPARTNWNQLVWAAVRHRIPLYKVPILVVYEMILALDIRFIITNPMKQDSWFAPLYRVWKFHVIVNETLIH